MRGYYEGCGFGIKNGNAQLAWLVMKNYKFVVLGSGVAAGHAVKELVQRKVEHGSVAVITADDTLPYDRPPLSKGFLLGEKSPEDILIEDVDFYNDHCIEVRLRQPVVNVDFDAKELECNPDGEVGYEQLLITTGSKVRRLEVPGAELDELYYLRSLRDAQRLRQRIARGGRAAVIGSGFIGMDGSRLRPGSQRRRADHDFSRGPRFEEIFTPEVSAFFQKYFAERGVKFMPNERVKAFLGTGKVERVYLESGREVPVDFVVAGIGVTPANDLFVGTGLEMNREGISGERVVTDQPARSLGGRRCCVLSGSDFWKTPPIGSLGQRSRAGKARRA